MLITKKRFLSALVLAVLAAGAVGYAASHFLDLGEMKKLEADRAAALDCRLSDATVRPCPVIYKNTRIEWRERVVTAPAPDRKQTERIAVLGAELARARITIHVLERARNYDGTPRTLGPYVVVQNGSMRHPYNTYDRCPAGTVAVYDATPLAHNSGDPNVCYVRRLALASPRH